jgi:hypothetical protein
MVTLFSAAAVILFAAKHLLGGLHYEAHPSGILGADLRFGRRDHLLVHVRGVRGHARASTFSGAADIVLHSLPRGFGQSRARSLNATA